MTTRINSRLQRLTATAMAFAMLVSSAGCASPFHFSPRLDTRLPTETGGEPPAKVPLAGDLHLSLAALMSQRRQLWQAAGETEQMKTATALGLIGLSAVALYRGVRYSDNTGWMQRAGLLGAATYAGAIWLEPSARQTIYLQGAMSLTCLALATAPYEMSEAEYRKVRMQVVGARAALERLATELRLVGRYTPKSETWWVVRGAWNKLRWSSGVLANADVALGNIEQAGPQLRDMTALLASDVATQVNRVSKDISELPSAIASLKPNVAMLVGSDVLAPPKKDTEDKNPPAGAEDSSSDGKTDPPAADTAATDGAAIAKDPQCSGSAGTATGLAAATEAKLAAAAVAADMIRTVKNAFGLNGKNLKDAKTASAPVNKASAPTAPRALPGDRDRADDLRKRILAVTENLDVNLGPVTSFVQRVASARNGLEIPAGCSAKATVRLVPDKQDLVLQPGETFQYLLEGDDGKAAASFVGPSLNSDVLDIAMPLAQATTAVRLTAGKVAGKPVTTTVRISDSRRQKNFDITVKVCPSS